MMVVDGGGDGVRRALFNESVRRDGARALGRVLELLAAGVQPDAVVEQVSRDHADPDALEWGYRRAAALAAELETDQRARAVLRVLGGLRKRARVGAIVGD